jgi:hypothetical protein
MTAPFEQRMWQVSRFTGASSKFVKKSLVSH